MQVQPPDQQIANILSTCHRTVVGHRDVSFPNRVVQSAAATTRALTSSGRHVVSVSIQGKLNSVVTLLLFMLLMMIVVPPTRAGAVNSFHNTSHESTWIFPQRFQSSNLNNIVVQRTAVCLHGGNQDDNNNNQMFVLYTIQVNCR